MHGHNGGGKCAPPCSLCDLLNLPLITFPLLFSSGFGFLAYETFKEAILAMNGTLTRVNKETGEMVLTPLGGLVCGALAGATSQTVA